MSGFNITAPSWWVDSEKRVWIVTSVTRGSPDHRPIEITMVQMGKIDYVRQPYEIIEKLIKQRQFSPL